MKKFFYQKNSTINIVVLKPYIYNYRTIYGDGNCFYRAAIFRYLEIVASDNPVRSFMSLIVDGNFSSSPYA